MKDNNFMRVLFCKIHCPFICFCKPPALYSSGPLKLENSPHVVPSKVVAVSDKSSLSGVKQEKGVNGNQEAVNVLKSCFRKIHSGEIGKKKVQWLDDLGKELAEIKEFESSETGDTDSEEENSHCLCIIL